MEGGARGDGTGTDLAGYLRALVGSLELSLEGRVPLRSNWKIACCLFDKAAAVGLAANELVTNAAKYAYPEG